jgi:hypothetical protein
MQTRIQHLRSNFCWKKWYLFIPSKPMKNLKATGEAFSSQENTQHLKTRNFYTFYFCGSFLSYRIRIPIPNADTDKDLAEQNHCGSGSTTLPVGVNFNLVNIIAYEIYRRSQLEAHQNFFIIPWTWQDVFDRLTKGANEQELREIGGYTFIK